MRVATRPFASLTAADVMSRDVVVIPQHLSLRAAAHLLSGAHVSGAPVIDASGACIGVISSTDFVAWAWGKQASCRCAATAEYPCSDWQVFDPETLPADEVAAHMTADVVTAGRNTRIGELARMMLDAHIHRVIIVDNERRPEGVVSTTDILAAVARSEGERSW